MRSRPMWWMVCLALVVAALPRPARAQGTSASIQGSVIDDSGPLPGATIVAKDTQSGFQHDAVTAVDGTFTLSGLRPGTYEITVTMAQFKPQSKTLQVQVGQSVTANFRITPDVLYTEAVEVIGNSRLVETRTSQIATTVTTEEVRYLPQNQRNFLNFAALAPGARVSNDETRKQVTAGGLDATQVNVFIDGVSYKNDVLDGGVVGQDSSRGIPFPQTAVQEFQVLTQNYKAEHEKASSTGHHRRHQERRQPLVGRRLPLLSGQESRRRRVLRRAARTIRKPTYDRFQPGIAIGGPIVRDRLQVFGSYEENRQDRDEPRVPRHDSISTRASIFCRAYEGTFVSPFREHLFFGKLSAQPRAGQTADLSYSFRNETDIRSFGGQDRASTRRRTCSNRVDSPSARWLCLRAHALNEATLTFQRSNWNPEAGEHHRRRAELHQGVMRIGGRDTTQEFVQTRAGAP